MFPNIKIWKLLRKIVLISIIKDTKYAAFSRTIVCDGIEIIYLDNGRLSVNYDLPDTPIDVYDLSLFERFYIFHSFVNLQDKINRDKQVISRNKLLNFLKDKNV